MKTIPQLRAVLSHEREKIPECNQEKFDIEANDFITNVSKFPEKYNHLSLHMWNRIKILQAIDTSHAPPILWMHDDETPEEHMERCYKAGGYGNGNRV